MSSQIANQQQEEMVMTGTIAIDVEDFTGQVRRRAPAVPRDARVGDLVERLRETLHLPEVDASGRPVLYGARNRQGNALNSSDVVGDVMAENDVLTITKSVTAGMAT
jgi:hypothetical protein